MQSNPPPNLANLNQIFNKYSTDGNADEQQINSIFKEVGYTDVYIGTIKKVIRLLNIDTPQKLTLNFLQVEQFAEAMENKGKFQVWKAKYQILEAIRQSKQDFFQQLQNNTAAPGAGPGSGQGSAPSKYGQQITNQDGQISFKIGQKPTDQHINFKLQKQKGNQIKPFIKLSVQRHTVQQAKNLQTIFKSIYQTLLQILKAQQQQYTQQIMSVSFITSVNGTTFNLFVTTNNQGLIQLIEMGADYLDLVINQPVNGKIQLNYDFGFDFMKFVSDKSYNFYDMFVKDCSLSVKWNVWGLFRNLRKILLKIDTFSQLKWDSADPFSLFMIALLHTQKFIGKLQFQNTTSQNQQTITKIEVIKILSQLKNEIQGFQNQSSVDIKGFLNQFDNKIVIQAGVRDWRLNIDAKLNNFTKIFTEDISKPQELVQNNSSQNYPYQQSYNPGNLQVIAKNENANQSDSDSGSNSKKSVLSGSSLKPMKKKQIPIKQTTPPLSPKAKVEKSGSKSQSQSQNQVQQKQQINQQITAKQTQQKQQKQ